MALLYCDSFDHYTSNAEFVRKKWTTSSADSSTAATGRHGTRAMTHGAWNRHVERYLGAFPSTLIAGAAFYYVSTMPTSAHRMFCFMDTASFQTELRLTSTGFLQVTRNDTLIENASIGQLFPDTWYYIEFKATVNNTTGSYEARVNGLNVVDGTNADTQNTANAYYNQIRIGSYTSTGSATWRVDDFYVCDNSGSIANDFLGDIRVECLWPNANGNSSQLDGSDGNTTDNYLLVDDVAAADDDTTYVASADTGDKDTYGYGDLATTVGDVYGVQINPLIRKSQAGTKRAASIARLSGTEVDSSDKIILDSYMYESDVRETKPGGGAWSISDVNSAEFGVKVTG